MSNENQRKEMRPTSGEAPFEPGEVFYSRTDDRGVIKSGNYVFQRVADYEWSELIGAPHKLIRHPDMPKGIFHLFWERLKRGETVGAYIKNKAKDGLSYWVFAVAIPIDGGYLSARLKPTSARLKDIIGLYNTAKAREVNDEFSPEQSAAQIVDDIKAMGFDHYEDFATNSLAEELLSETRMLGLPQDERIATSKEMLAKTKLLVAESTLLFKDFVALSAIPKNMQIKAAILEPAGGPLTALSINYGQMSAEISNQFNADIFGKKNNFTTIADNVKSSLLMNNIAEILHRCDAQLKAELRDLASLDIEAERKLLSQIATDYAKSALQVTEGVINEAQNIQTACDEITRSLLGLSTVSVNCKMENARLTGEHAGGLDMVISQLLQTQENVGRHLKVIKTLIGDVREAADTIRLKGTHKTADVLLYGEKMAAAVNRRKIQDTAA